MAFVRKLTTTLCVAVILVAAAGATGEQASRRSPVTALKVTILSANLADPGVGEWGFAALLEVDGGRLLIDTGARPETVLRNAEELGIDLSSVTDLVLTHNHGDHVGGLVTLRRELAKRNRDAIKRAHVAPGILQGRVDSTGQQRNGLLRVWADYAAAGGTVTEHSAPAELLPGVWLSGPVPRRSPERWGADLRLQSPSGLVDDTVPEDASVVVDTPAGLVVVTGCAHAGVVNITEYARTFRESPPIHALVGGLHLYGATDAQLAWTGGKLRDMGVAYLLGAHCTGIEAVYRLRESIGLTRQTAVVGAVGASFTLGKGIDPLQLAR